MRWPSGDQTRFHPSVSAFWVRLVGSEPSATTDIDFCVAIPIGREGNALAVGGPNRSPVVTGVLRQVGCAVASTAEIPHIKRIVCCRAVRLYEDVVGTGTDGNENLEIEARSGIAVPSQDIARAVQNEDVGTRAARHRGRQDARTVHLKDEPIHITL